MRYSFSNIFIKCSTILTEGLKYLVVDLSQKNIGNEQIHYNLLYFEVSDQDGRRYDSELMISIGLANSFASGTILNGELIRGEIAFKVPEDSSIATLIFEDLRSSFRVTLLDIHATSE